METNYKDRLIQSLKDELERVRAERDALRAKLEQTEMDLEVTRMNLGDAREECNRLEDEVADRRKDVEARDRVILELSRPSSCKGDLISRSALVDKIEGTTWYHINELGELGEGANPERHTPLFKADDIFVALENAPTVDAVEVCRCEDCLHYDLGVCLKIYSDGNVSADAWQERESDDFCSGGERRTDE